MDNNNLNQEITNINNKIERLREVYVKVQKLIEQNKNNINQIQVLTKKVNSLENQIQNLQKQSQYLEMVTKFIQKFGKDKFKVIASFKGGRDDWQGKISHLEQEIGKIITELANKDEEIIKQNEFISHLLTNRISDIRNYFGQEYFYKRIDKDSNGTTVWSMVRNRLSSYLRINLQKLSEKHFNIKFKNPKDYKKRVTQELETWIFHISLNGKPLAVSQDDDTDFDFEINIKTIFNRTLKKVLERIAWRIKKELDRQVPYSKYDRTFPVYEKVKKIISKEALIGDEEKINKNDINIGIEQTNKGFEIILSIGELEEDIFIEFANN